MDGGDPGLVHAGGVVERPQSALVVDASVELDVIVRQLILFVARPKRNHHPNEREEAKCANGDGENEEEDDGQEGEGEAVKCGNVGRRGGGRSKKARVLF